MDGLTDPGLALYVAAAVAVVVWLGIFAFLWRIDAQARALRAALRDRQPDPARPAAAVRPERQQPTPARPLDHEGGP